MHCQQFDELILLLSQHNIKDYVFKPVDHNQFTISQFTIELDHPHAIIYSNYLQPYDGNEDYNQLLKIKLAQYQQRLIKTVCKPDRWMSIYEYQFNLQQQLNTTVTINENLVQHYPQHPCYLPCSLAKTSYIGHSFQSTHFSWSLTIGPLSYDHFLKIQPNLPIPSIVFLQSVSLKNQYLGQILTGYTKC